MHTRNRIASSSVLIFCDEKVCVFIRAGPSRCGAQCKTWARCSLNRVTIVTERRHAV